MGQRRDTLSAFALPGSVGFNHKNKNKTFDDTSQRFKNLISLAAREAPTRHTPSPVSFGTSPPDHPPTLIDNQQQEQIPRLH
jgi:hypothetical protein